MMLLPQAASFAVCRPDRIGSDSNTPSLVEEVAGALAQGELQPSAAHHVF
jgi:hypothetical protein